MTVVIPRRYVTVSGCPECSGMGVRNAPEWVSGMVRNGCPEWSGIRMLPLVLIYHIHTAL